MLGQWIGTFGGTNSGELIIDIDRVNEHFVCTASVFDKDKDLPNFHADFSFTAELAKTDEFSLKIASPVK